MVNSAAEEMYSQMLYPGAVWLTSGFRGGGKTHTAIAVSEQLVKGMYPKVGRVFVLTNIIFYHKLGNGRLEVQCPPGVHHVETMRETFWKIYEILRDNGNDVTILLILDEAQNFVGGDTNASNSSAMMKEFLGTIRKFRLAVWFLCPSKQSIGPAFRNWINDPKYPGNLTAEWKKDLSWNSKFIQEKGLKASPKAFIFARNYNWKKPKLINVPVTEWTRTKEEIRPGQYCYDHEASATFHVGDGFDWEDFNRVLGGTASIDLLPTIERYYGCLPSPDDPPKEDGDDDGDILDIASRLKDATGLPWTKISEIIGIPRNTLRDRLKSAGKWKDEWDKNGRKTRDETPENGQKPKIQLRQPAGVASGVDDGQDGGHFDPSRYISNENAVNTLGGVPVFVREDDDGEAGTMSDSGSSRPPREGYDGGTIRWGSRD